MLRLELEQGEKLKEIHRRILSTAKEATGIIDKINKIVNERLRGSIEEYNRAVGEANEFREAIVARMNEHINSHPDGWEDSDEGERYVYWRDDWDNVELEPLDGIDELEISVDVEGTAEKFGNLTEKPEV